MTSFIKYINLSLNVFLIQCLRSPDISWERTAFRGINTYTRRPGVLSADDGREWRDDYGFLPTARKMTARRPSRETVRRFDHAGEYLLGPSSSGRCLWPIH